MPEIEIALRAMRELPGVRLQVEVVDLQGVGPDRDVEAVRAALVSMTDELLKRLLP